MAERKKPISPIQLKEENSELLRENRTLREARTATRLECANRLKQKEEELEEYKQKSESLEKERAAAYATLTDERKLRRNQLEIDKKDLECLKKRVEDLKETNDALKETNDALKETNNALKEDNDALKKTNDDLKDAINALKETKAAQRAQDDAQRREERHTTLEQLQTCQEELQNAKETNNDLRRQLQASQNEITRLRRLSDVRNDQPQLQDVTNLSQKTAAAHQTLQHAKDVTTTVRDSIEGIKDELRLQRCVHLVQPFAGDDHEDFLRWRDEIERTLMQLTDENGSSARSLALQTLSGSAESFAARLIKAEPHIGWSELRKAMEERYFSRADVLSARQELQTLRQDENEKVASFYERIMKLATRVHSQDIIDDRLIQTELVETFINGLNHGETMKLLIETSPTTLEEALQLAAKEESTEREFKARRGPPVQLDDATKLQDIPELMKLRPTPSLRLMRSPQCYVNFGRKRAITLIDTGAEVSVMKDTALKKIPSDCITEITEPHYKCCVGPEGSPMTPTMTAYITLDFGDTVVTHPFLVVNNIRKNLIIGSDFLIDHKAKVDLEKMTLELHGEEPIELFLSAGDRDEPRVPVLTTPMTWMKNGTTLDDAMNGRRLTPHARHWTPATAPLDPYRRP